MSKNLPKIIFFHEISLLRPHIQKNYVPYVLVCARSRSVRLQMHSVKKCQFCSAHCWSKQQAAKATDIFQQQAAKATHRKKNNKTTTKQQQQTANTHTHRSLHEEAGEHDIHTENINVMVESVQLDRIVVAFRA